MASTVLKLGVSSQVSEFHSPEGGGKQKPVRASMGEACLSESSISTYKTFCCHNQGENNQNIRFPGSQKGDYDKCCFLGFNSV